MATVKDKNKNLPEPKTEQEPTTENQEPSEDKFPVIGIGASAGGLEALSDLFDSMPADTGAGFVVVQHLAPSKDSAMPELLGRHTRMPARQITDNLEIEPDTIYLIPPAKNLSLLNGKLQLLEQAEPSGIHHPIDFFFRSLAADRGAGAVGIILSGTGTDGTVGARAIKAELGLVIAQDPEEAKYDGMPRSVIDSGLADYTLKAGDISGQIVDYIKRIPQVISPPAEGTDDLANFLPKIITLIRNETGNDFSSYKENTLLRRIKRRMAIHQISEASRYVRFLQENPKETSVLFKELLINVTSFFRDKEAFEVLKEQLKERLEHKPPQEEIRVWVVGCATGEEAYSIAIIIREILGDLDKDHKVQIFGTDLDSDAIDIARNGVYRTNISDDITPERLKKFFTLKDDTYRVKKDIREMLVFAVHNLIKEPPFLKMDLVSARNLLIYLKGDIQKRILPLFHYALRENGLLLLSPSETIGEFTDLFASLDRKWKLYHRKDSSSANGRAPQFPLQAVSGNARPEYRPGGVKVKQNDILQVTDKMLLSEYAPPYVVIDSADNVVYVRGDPARFLKLAEGRTNMNILEMARLGLRGHLSLAIRNARSQKAEARREGVAMGPELPTAVDILVKPVPIQGQPSEYLMVIFKESAVRESPPAQGKAQKKGQREKPSEKDQQILELEQELKQSREDLQATIEELETSNEEMKSSNEELLSSNEELQSTNEELETSREELRSVNEELSTLNTENQERIEQLAQSRGDLHNLLNTINVATLFLDTDLNIKSYTPSATGLFKLRESDTGRPLSEIVTNLAYDRLVEDAREVLHDLVPRNKEAQSREGRWYLMRILPYRTEENAVVGLVITFFDIDERRILQAALSYTQNIIDTLRESVLVLDKDLKVVSANRSFYQVFRTGEKETLKKCIWELGNRQWDIPRLRKLLEEILPENQSFDNFPVEHVFPVIGKRRMLLNARRMYEELGGEKILLAIEDVTGQPWAEKLFTGKEGGKN